VIKIKIS